MDDLISRQAAINAIYALSNRPIAWLESAVDEIEALPSAQPEAEERMPETEQSVPNDELISKEAAIDVADAVWGVTVEKNFAKAWDQIKELPSAQPEIIHCRECAYADNYYQCPFVKWWAGPDDYCSRAERKQDG